MVVGVIVSTIVIVAVFAGTVVVILVTKRKCSVRGNHNIKVCATQYILPTCLSYYVALDMHVIVLE